MQARERGMTLLEVLLAMTVLALGVFAAAALHLRSVQASGSALREMHALQLARSQLEQARAAGTLEVGDGAAQRRSPLTLPGRVLP